MEAERFIYSSWRFFENISPVLIRNSLVIRLEEVLPNKHLLDAGKRGRSFSGTVKRTRRTQTSGEKRIILICSSYLFTLIKTYPLETTKCDWKVVSIGTKGTLFALPGFAFDAFEIPTSEGHGLTQYS